MISRSNLLYMKKLVVLSIFISTLGYGQFFDSSEIEEPEYTFHQQEFFTEPDYGTDDSIDPNPGGVDEVPVNHWQLYLSVLGVILGGYFLSRHRN